jgi:hypothetical protein
MISFDVYAGLGNQLFMIFCTIALALQNNSTFGFKNKKILAPAGEYTRHTYYDTLLSSLKPYLYDILPPSILIFESSQEFMNIVINPLYNYQLYGYFQSYKYFINEYDIIYKLLNITYLKNNVLIKNIIPFNYQYTVSLHFRIGDYIHYSHVYPILPINYYKNALTFLSNKIKHKLFILYFCEDADLDVVLKHINKLSLDFPEFQFKRCNHELHDWEQLLLMSCCYHNIIANSTFSWWGGMFNTNENKMVLYPSTWFSPTATHCFSQEPIHNKTYDMFPLNWIKINY